MGDKPVGALLCHHFFRFKLFAKYVVGFLESEMLAHAVERGLGVERGTVSRTADVVKGGAGGRGDFPHVKPEAALEDAAVEVETVGGGFQVNSSCRRVAVPGMGGPIRGC